MGGGEPGRYLYSVYNEDVSNVSIHLIWLSREILIKKAPVHFHRILKSLKTIEFRMDHSYDILGNWACCQDKNLRIRQVYQNCFANNLRNMHICGWTAMLWITKSHSTCCIALDNISRKCMGSVQANRRSRRQNLPCFTNLT